MRRRILHLIDSEGIFGAERVILELLPLLYSMDFDVFLGCLTPRNSKGFELGLRANDIGIQTFLFDERKKISFGIMKKIYKTMREHKIGILHTHGYKATIIGGIVARFLRKPLVATYHGLARLSGVRPGYLRIENLFIRNANSIIAVSHQIKEELIKRGVPTERIRVIYNGIHDEFEDVKQTELGRKGNNIFSPHLIAVGRLVEVKRFDLAIDAIKELKKKFEHIGLSIAGDGPLLEKLSRRAKRLGVEKQINFMGYVKNPKDLYRNGDIFILCSDSEGSPMALLEAMSASLPIVATSVGSISEWFIHREHGILVQTGSLGGLIDGISLLSQNKELRSAVAKKAREKFLSHFKIERVSKEYAEVYGSLINLEN